MNQESVWAGLGDAFTRPFSKGNPGRFFLGLLFLLVPFLFIIADGDAHLMAAGRGKSLSDRVRMGLKILLVRLIYAGPVLLIYGIQVLLTSYFETMPLMVPALLILLQCLFVMRFLILAPVAACCLALGAPMKIAANGKEMKRIVSGSMGRYLLYTLLSLVIIVPLAFFITKLPYIWQFIAAAPFAWIYTYVAAGLYMSCVRRSLDLPVPPRGNVSYPGAAAMRAAAFGMAFVMFVTSVPLKAFAKGVDTGDTPQPVQPLESSGGYTYDRSFDSYRDAYEYAQEKGLLTQYNEIRKEDNGSYSISSKYGVEEGSYDPLKAEHNIEQAKNALLFVADVGLDFVPVLGNVKNGIQAVYYGYKSFTADTEEERQAARVTAGYKVVGLALGGLGKAAALAKTGKGCLWLKTWLGASKLEKASKVLEYTSDGQDVYDGLVNVLTVTDVVSGREDSEAMSPNGLLTTFNYLWNGSDGGFQLADPPRNMVYVYPGNGSPYTNFVIPDPDNTSISGDTPVLDPAETLPPEGILIVPEDLLNKYNPKGTYYCTITKANLTNVTVPGLKYTLAPATVYVTIDDNLTAGFDVILDLTIAYDIAQAGIKTTMKSNVRLTQRWIQGEMSPTGEMVTYTFTDVRDVITESSYSGEGFTGGGGSVKVTNRTEYTVTFYLSGTSGSLLSQPEWRIDGKISVKPVSTEGAMAGLDQASEIEFQGSIVKY